MKNYFSQRDRSLENNEAMSKADKNQLIIRVTAFKKQHFESFSDFANIVSRRPQTLEMMQPHQRKMLRTYSPKIHSRHKTQQSMSPIDRRQQLRISRVRGHLQLYGQCESPFMMKMKTQSSLQTTCRTKTSSLANQKNLLLQRVYGLKSKIQYEEKKLHKLDISKRKLTNHISKLNEERDTVQKEKEKKIFLQDTEKIECKSIEKDIRDINERSKWIINRTKQEKEQISSLTNEVTQLKVQISVHGRQLAQLRQSVNVNLKQLDKRVFEVEQIEQKRDQRIYELEKHHVLWPEVMHSQV